MEFLFMTNALTVNRFSLTYHHWHRCKNSQNEISSLLTWWQTCIGCLSSFSPLGGNISLGMHQKTLASENDHLSCFVLLAQHKMMFLTLILLPSSGQTQGDNIILSPSSENTFESWRCPGCNGLMLKAIYYVDLVSSCHPCCQEGDEGHVKSYSHLTLMPAHPDAHCALGARLPSEKSQETTRDFFVPLAFFIVSKVTHTHTPHTTHTHRFSSKILWASLQL